MKEYHKIQTIYKRDQLNIYKTLVEGQFSLPEFEYLAENEWVFTEKVDGTNIRVIFADGTISFGGKTDGAQIPSFLINRLNELFQERINTMKEVFQFDVCLYGEGYGAKIQKCGGNFKPTQDFVLFDVRVKDIWLQRENVEDIAKNLCLDIVPIIGEGSLFEMVEMVRTGFDSTWGPFLAEGIVARPKIELKTRNGERIITKIKHTDFERRQRI